MKADGFKASEVTQYPHSYILSTTSKAQPLSDGRGRDCAPPPDEKEARVGLNRRNGRAH